LICGQKYLKRDLTGDFDANHDIDKDIFGSLDRWELGWEN
jgi:hypothetical protein